MKIKNLPSQTNKNPQGQKWRRLDNTGKLFPLVSSESLSNVFRIAVTLKEEIEPEILQQALEDVLTQFESFRVRLRRGLFWYYFETNPKGVMKIGIGTHRGDRILLDDDRSKFSIVSIPEDGNWTLKFYIPDEFINSHFKKPNPVFKGNVYKCAESSDHSHFGTWNRVEVPNPDYHLTDFFGTFEIKK